MQKYIIRKAEREETKILYRDFVEKYFPEDEIKPLDRIIRMQDDGMYTVLVLEYNGIDAAVACLTSMEDGRTFLLDYLAVHHEYRGIGLGSMIVKECSAMCPNMAILVETEAVETADNEEQLQQIIKRNRFYEKLGCTMSGIKTNIFGVIYNNWVLCEGTEFDDEFMQRKLTEVYSYMIPVKEIYDENVFIPFGE